MKKKKTKVICFTVIIFMILLIMTVFKFSNIAKANESNADSDALLKQCNSQLYNAIDKKLIKIEEEKRRKEKEEQERLEEERIKREKKEEEQKLLNRVLDDISSRGASGRLIIPSVGVDVAVFERLDDGQSDSYYAQSQVICDNQDSAVSILSKPTITIGDHNNQGFNAIKNIKVGDEAIIHRGYTIDQFKCVQIGIGINDGEFLHDENGNIIENYGENYISLYTCNEDWQHITYVILEKI